MNKDRTQLYEYLCTSPSNQIRQAQYKIAAHLGFEVSYCETMLQELINLGKITFNGEYYSVIHKEKPTHEKCPPVAYRVYNYLKEMAVGKDNAMSMSSLAKWHGISERELRQIVYNINYRVYELANGNTFKRKIYGGNDGYFIVANEEEMLSMLHQRKVKLLNRVKEFKILQEDFGLNNQIKLSLSEFESDLVKSISDDL